MKNKYPYIIAEIGTAHEGSLSLGRELIDAAAESGADCVKFQYVIANEIIHPKTGTVLLPGGTISLYKRFRQLEQQPEFYQSLKAYAEERDIDFLCTPFGKESARNLHKMGVQAFKIASPELNYKQLLTYIASLKKPIFLSSGVSKLGDIEAAIEICRDAECPAVLMHCVTSYPAPEEEYNLSLLPLYSSLFGVTVGTSDHSLDPILIPALSVLQGACTIEKHFTFSNSGKGLDDPIALMPEHFKKTAAIAKQAKEAPEETRKELLSTYGENRINAVLGTGIKQLSASEFKYYGRTNRSVHALSPLLKGDIITEKNSAVLRSEQHLRPGISPYHYETILGKQVSHIVEAGEGIRWQDLLH